MVTNIFNNAIRTCMHTYVCTYIIFRRSPEIRWHLHTGDVRANEQPGLTSMHTVFVRLHNVFENQMYRFNRHLNSEQLYQVQRLQPCPRKNSPQRCTKTHARAQIGADVIGLCLL